MGAQQMTNVKLKSANTNVATQGELKFIRASELNKSGTTGIVALGTYEGTMPNNIDAEKLDYKIRLDNGDLAIVNVAGNLKYRMEQAFEQGLTEGGIVQISYNGMKPATGGKYKGKPTHDFSVDIEDSGPDAA